MKLVAALEQAWLAGLVLSVAALAGCLTSDAPVDSATIPAAGTEASTCVGSCTSFPIEIAPLQAGEWGDVRILWDGTTSPPLAGEATSPSGEVEQLARGFDSLRLVAWEEGTWHVSFWQAGEGLPATTYHVTSTVGPGSPAASDLLPNLVTLSIRDPHFGSCQQVEEVEQGAKRCLRLGNAGGNVGYGPMEVRLTFDQAAATVASEVGLLEGTFVQRIHQVDGTVREEPVGAADWHMAHSHFHYDGFALFTLHPVDEHGLRGEAIGQGTKSGFCLVDWGEMDAKDTPPHGNGGNAENACLVPGAAGWTMGVSVGWYDYYSPSLTDQYVEASGASPGLYELVSTVDPFDQLLETDESDNTASVLLEIGANTVDVVEHRAFWQTPQ